jgi:RNA polymerase-binding transcription factor DksA
MNSTQYSDYLRDRKVALEKQIAALQKKLFPKGAKKTLKTLQSDEGILLGKAQVALSIVVEELARIDKDELMCLRCGCALPEDKEEVLKFAQYCKKCAN